MRVTNRIAAVARMGMTAGALAVLLLIAATALDAIPAAAFHEDEGAAKAEAAYREAVLGNGAANAENARWEAQRLEDLKPRLTESQRRELDRCVANGMIYVSPSVGCRSYREDW